MKEKTRDLMYLLILVIFLNLFINIISGVGFLLVYGIISFQLIYIFFINFLLRE